MKITRVVLASAVVVGSLAMGAPAVAQWSRPRLAPTYEVRESVEQISVTGLTPGTGVHLVRPLAATPADSDTTEADALGSVLFRNLAPGGDYSVEIDGVVTDGLVVASPDSIPDQSLYEGQTLEEGFQYITTRDGTELSINVVLPGPIEDGPYPTVVEYSGYDPSNPLAGLGGLVPPGVDPTTLCGSLPVLCKAPAQPASLLAGLLGYAVVGVNVRGTGCSGGAYDFFETLQVLDGYDAIETIGAQDWVKQHHVGMVGLSYPGIAQLFVAQSQPPSLASIAPLSVYGDTATGVLRPGGILNTGFAVSWASQVLANAAPSGTDWVRQLIAEGDTVCADNQLLRLQNVDIVEKAENTRYYTDEVAGPLDVRRFADKINVPIFLASGWQDEQTGPSFADLLDRFDSAPVKRFTLYNGLHADGFAPQILSEWNAFLDLYVDNEVPSIPPIIRSLAPVFTQAIFGGGIPLPPDRWGGVANATQARQKYEAEPEVRVIFESGGGAANGLPVGAFEHTAARWPDPAVAAHRWWLTPTGGLQDQAGSNLLSYVSFEPDQSAGDTTYFSGGSSAIWKALPAYDWKPALARHEVAFETGELSTTMTMLGTGSVDLWVQSSAIDADLEVVVSEVRPDQQEMLVQSGRLRASFRALEADSTELHPTHLGREADISALPAAEWTKVRVLIPAFGHVFRAGSRIRIAVNTPGGDQATWSYDILSLPAGTRHHIGTGGVAASSVALPVLSGLTVPTPLPACPSLRGQPCRPTGAIVFTTSDLPPAQPPVAPRAAAPGFTG
jgi:hypothetical protein